MDIVVIKKPEKFHFEYFKAVKKKVKCELVVQKNRRYFIFFS